MHVQQLFSRFSGLRLAKNYWDLAFNSKGCKTWRLMFRIKFKYKQQLMNSRCLCRPTTFNLLQIDWRGCGSKIGAGEIINVFWLSFSVIDSQSKGRSSNVRRERNLIADFCSICSPSQLICNVYTVRTLLVERRLSEGEGEIERHPPSYAEAEIMELLTLYTNDCFRADLRNCSSS